MISVIYYLVIVEHVIIFIVLLASPNWKASFVCLDCVFKLLFCLILSNCIDWFVLIGMVRVYFGQFRSLSKIFCFLRVWHEIKLKLFRKRWFLRLEFYFFIYLLISCRKHIRTAQTCFFITVKWQFVCVLFHSSFFPYICQIAAFLFT